MTQGTKVEERRQARPDCGTMASILFRQLRCYCKTRRQKWRGSVSQSEFPRRKSPITERYMEQGHTVCMQVQQWARQASWEGQWCFQVAWCYKQHWRCHCQLCTSTWLMSSKGNSRRVRLGEPMEGLRMGNRGDREISWAARGSLGDLRASMLILWEQGQKGETGTEGCIFI